jgi:hypothetical protein
MKTLSYLCLLALVVIACNDSPTTAVETPKVAVAEVDTLDKGDVILVFHPPKDQRYNKIFKSLESHQVLDAVVNDFNNTLALPNDIEIHFEECDTKNAFYYADTKQITVCYELIYDYVEKSDLDISFDKKIEEATVFTMLHELGHALVDQLQIPITGKEENAVDEFAMMMLLDANNTSAIDLALEGVFQFYYDAIDETSVDYSDQHAPSMERYFDLLSIYCGAGHDSTNYYVGQEDWQLSQARSEQSVAEYEKKRLAWDTLLADYYK